MNGRHRSKKLTVCKEKEKSISAKPYLPCLLKTNNQDQDQVPDPFPWKDSLSPHSKVTKSCIINDDENSNPDAYPLHVNPQCGAKPTTEPEYNIDAAGDEVPANRAD